MSPKAFALNAMGVTARNLAPGSGMTLIFTSEMGPAFGLQLFITTFDCPVRLFARLLTAAREERPGTAPDKQRSLNVLLVRCHEALLSDPRGANPWEEASA
jgi:hypothetical protein